MFKFQLAPCLFCAVASSIPDFLDFKSHKNGNALAKLKILNSNENKNGTGLMRPYRTHHLNVMQVEYSSIDLWSQT
jgi:hypothetical protein